MRRLLVTLSVILLAGSCRPELPKGWAWEPKTGAFRWPGGEIHLPAGYTYRLGEGVDSAVGYFNSPNGDITIEHDIGGYAGVWADRADAMAFEERVVDGSRVLIAIQAYTGAAAGTFRIAVSFPDAGSGNFFLKTSNPERDADIIQGIADSFRPIGR